MQIIGNELRADFRVSLGLKNRALIDQFLAQLRKVFDNAIVDDGDAVGRMGVCVALGRRPVGCPARMADPGGAGERRGAEGRLKRGELAAGAPALEAGGRIVAGPLGAEPGSVSPLRARVNSTSLETTNPSPFTSLRTE